MARVNITTIDGTHFSYEVGNAEDELRELDRRLRDPNEVLTDHDEDQDTLIPVRMVLRVQVHGDVPVSVRAPLS